MDFQTLSDEHRVRNGRRNEGLRTSTGTRHLDKLLPLLKPYPSGEMEFYPVTRAVNSPTNDSPYCIVPA
jgi:putative SOS response-associated peptidase YedK